MTKAGSSLEAASRRLALVAPTATSVLRLRAGLVRDIIGRGHQVLCVTGTCPPDDARALRELGMAHRELDLEPKAIPLLSAWRVTGGLLDIFREWEPHVVLGAGLRVMIACALAGRRARVPHIVALCTGLPSHDLDPRHTRRIAHALRSANAVVFHNRDDRRRLMMLGLVPKTVPAHVVSGAGVDLDHHTYRPLPPPGPGLVFLMIGRLERSRGIIEYATAARALKASAPESRFLLISAPPEDQDDAVTVAALAAASAGAIEQNAPVGCVREVLGACHVYVHPSYGEGMPPTVLEALATGRPVVTTDTPGCRETVDDMVSGCLVPPRDTAALTSAMETFVRRPDIIPALSRAARLKAERRFDRAAVNRTLIGILGL